MRYLFFTIIGFFYFSSNVATALTLKCPHKKNNTAFNVVAIFWDDPKKGNYDLKPDNGDSPMPHYWSIDGEDKLWLVCKYGSELKKLFTTKIKGQVSSCHMIESVPKSGQYDSIECK
jgi:hypothetical protein